MNPKDLRRLDRVRSSCNKCNSLGYIIKHGENGISLQTCACSKKIDIDIALDKANIPEQYRGWNLSKLTKKVVETNPKSIAIINDYIEKLDNYIDSGKGLWLFSPPGMAKSSIVCHILNEAQQKGYVAYFARASHLISLKFNALQKENVEARDELKYLLNDVDILAIEEIEKVYMSQSTSMPAHLFFELLSDLYDSRVSLLITSNTIRDEEEKNFPSYIQDRMKLLKSVPIFGTSGRKDIRFAKYLEGNK